MERHIFYITFISLLFCACSSSVTNVTNIAMDDSLIVVLDKEKVTEKRTVKLSEIVEDFQIIRFETKDESFFKANWMYFSDNYICIRQDGAPIKLFRKSGKYIGNVGGFGQGPGEYQFIYDVLLDEKGKSIYVMPYVSDYVLQYDLTGKLIDKISFGEKLNKGRLFLSSNDVLSVVHLAFRDLDCKFTGANVQLQNKDSIQYVYMEDLASNMTNEQGIRTGFDDEIWSYRNTSAFPFMMTHADTLYHYDSQKNIIQATFTMPVDQEKKGDCFFIFNEWPHYYFINVVGKNSMNILVDKELEMGYQVDFVNDFMGNMKVYPRTQDGYFHQNWEPGALKEELEKTLSSGDCPEEQKEKLQNLMQTLHENDNNVLFIGKLKQ